MILYKTWQPLEIGCCDMIAPTEGWSFRPVGREIQWVKFVFTLPGKRDVQEAWIDANS